MTFTKYPFVTDHYSNHWYYINWADPYMITVVQHKLAYDTDPNIDKVVVRIPTIISSTLEL